MHALYILDCLDEHRNGMLAQTYTFCYKKNR